jgi:hypothetical protein
MYMSVNVGIADIVGGLLSELSLQPNVLNVIRQSQEAKRTKLKVSRFKSWTKLRWGKVSDKKE